VSKKINPTSIGLFIVTGVALGVAALLLFGSSKWFTHAREFIVYFDDSVNGLNEGAPVKFRGVTVGSVKRVMVRYNQATNDNAMPVILEIQDALIRERLEEADTVFSEGSLMARIKAGLRASLQTESLVTGVLYVDIRPNPKAPPAVFHQLEKRLPEIPTEPTDIQRLFDNLASLDVKSIETNLNSLLVRLDSTVGSLRMAEISHEITNLLASVNRLVTDPDLTNGLAGIRPTLDQYRELGVRLTDQVDPLADRLTNSLAGADRAVAQFRGAAENLRTLLAPESALRAGLDQTLTDLGAAAQSINALVDFLKRNPNAIIVGRDLIPKKQ
jgi:paraquat-inducible protein B